MHAKPPVIRNGDAPGHFRRFAAIDWSGAKGSRHRNIAVAICDSGEAAPRLIEPERPWSRTGVLAWLVETSKEVPTLYGFDFSHAPPIMERGAYLPGEKDPPDNAKDFWAYVDRLCDDEDLGAASFLEKHHRRHFYFGASDGVKADFLHHRVCEHAFNAIGGGKASTVYDAIGASQVAKASYAGMRLLHRLNGKLPVWPMDPVPAEGSLVVEIYTRVFILLAGLKGGKVRSREVLNRALDALGSRPAELAREPDDHATDALIASAGLRAIAEDPRYWRPKALTRKIARSEGWTFGIS
ncbi:hypothetical protein [Sphingosinicella rhizophila]|uniref:DUF429 domain-containing protein n=1 Tax=Sphingosinicella rhizophila TaxID=3050082 RepID=A0ABU3Q4L4_9SPHN|nr:hypothetical protein [Sphingosinicella sp. GR2756]MDT9598353.1 hypothetical protein [Sphingosinicella sp. GR2756]